MKRQILARTFMMCAAATLASGTATFARQAAPAAATAAQAGRGRGPAAPAFAPTLFQ